MTTISTPNGIQMFHLLSQRAALDLEIKGLKFSKGSVYAHIKRTYGFKGNKVKVLAQFTAYIQNLQEKEHDNT